MTVRRQRLSSRTSKHSSRAEKRPLTEKEKRKKRTKKVIGATLLAATAAPLVAQAGQTVAQAVSPQPPLDFFAEELPQECRNDPLAHAIEQYEAGQDPYFQINIEDLEAKVETAEDAAERDVSTVAQHEGELCDVAVTTHSAIHATTEDYLETRAELGVKNRAQGTFQQLFNNSDEVDRLEARVDELGGQIQEMREVHGDAARVLAMDDAPGAHATAAVQLSGEAAEAHAKSQAALGTIDRMLKYDPGSRSVGWSAAEIGLGLVNGDLRNVEWREWAGEGMKPASTWSLSQYFAAALDDAMLTGDLSRVEQVVQELDKYQIDGAYSPGAAQRSGPIRQLYYDDNVWVALDFVQAYRQTGDAQYLQKAEALVPFFETGFQPGGGIAWRDRDDNPTINTCTNAPAMQLFLLLYEETGNPRYLDDALHVEKALNGSLRRSDGLYSDNYQVKQPQNRDEMTWSYNQGTAIGANLQMAETVKDPAQKAHYLELARTTADAVLDRMEKDPNWIWSNGPSFNAILFRNLVKYDQAIPDARVHATLKQYLARAEAEARNPQNGAYELGGIGRYGEEVGGITLIDQSGMVQMLTFSGLTPEQVAKLS